MSRDLLIFDMDGVLVDVGASYRAAIQQTVEHFTGIPVTPERIQEFKNAGGYNDDWVLSFRLIRDAGIEAGFDTVVAHFQKIFRGANGNDGLILREEWMAQDGLLERLAQRYRLAIFTGRFQEEAQVTLGRFAPQVFDPVVGADDVQALKPHPEGLFRVRALAPSDRVFYFGDTVDDAMSAKSAGVPFIGIAGPEAPRREETVAALRGHGAKAVLRSINEIEAAIASL